MKLTLFGAVGLWIIILALFAMMLAECVHPAQSNERREYRRVMEHNFSEAK
jgi:hypothetical protein